MLNSFNRVDVLSNWICALGYLGLWACTIHVVLPFAGLVCVILEHFCFQWSSFLAVMLVAMGQRRGLRQRGLVAGGCGGD